MAFAAGLAAGWAWFRAQVSAGFVARAVHEEQLLGQRRRYRRRLRALRDGLLRHKRGERDLQEQLRVATQHQATEARLHAAARTEAAELQRQVGDQAEAIAALERSLAEVRDRGQALEAAERDAAERLAAYEHQHGLMRIEREELLARTERLKALAPAAAGAVPPPEPDAAVREPQAQGVTRADLAQRNARIHELECRLRETEARAGELADSLNTWKYRIAPLALHLKARRERAQATPAAPPAAPGGHDDLKRIRGIGRALEKKMHAAGVTRVGQLADMSPAELANLAERIGIAPSRPGRDRWAEQARRLADRTAGAAAGAS